MGHKHPAAATAPNGEHAYLQIGEVAERTGVTQRTLRFYEEKGLVKPPTRLEGGFRLYSEQDVLRVEQIKRLQDLLGLKLAEIKDMVEGEEVRSEMRATYRPDLSPAERLQRLENLHQITERQREIIEHKIAALVEMKTDFDQKIDRYETLKKELREELDRATENRTAPTL